MKIIEPIEITENTLTSSNVAENDASDWDNGTAYTAGNTVIYQHKVYEALDNTTGDQPDISPLKWLDLGATNRWRMFDTVVGTRTTNLEKIEVELDTTGLVQAIALLECSAVSARVIATDTTEGVVYDRKKNFEITMESANWWQYFFGPFARRESLVFDDFPSYWGMEIAIIIEASGPTVNAECGTCMLGRYHIFADAVRVGARMEMIDYSRKHVDDWGNISITERAYAKKASWDLVLRRNQSDYLFRTLSRLRAKPAIYIGGTKEDLTFVFGYPRDWGIVINYPHVVHCNIELEGLI